MQHEGKYWPTEEDKLARSTVWHVPKAPLTAPPEEYVPGMTRVVATESAEGVTNRLSEEFPLYRIAKWGENVLNKVFGHEV